MDYAEIFWNNIASLVLIPTVVIIVLKLKNVQIDSLREENNVLKEQAKLLGLFRISEVEKEFKAMKKFYERREKEAERAKKKLDKITKELENVRSMTKKEAELVALLFKTAIGYAAVSSRPVPSTAVYTVAKSLYTMKGPIGELWREYWDGGKLWWLGKEHKRKKKEGERKLGSST